MPVAAGATPGGGTGTPQERNHYKVINSYFAGNKKLAGTGTGARVEFADIDPAFLEMSGTKMVEQPVAFEHDSTKRNYLHPVAGFEAAKIGAGLFHEAARNSAAYCDITLRSSVHDETDSRSTVNVLGRHYRRLARRSGRRSSRAAARRRRNH